MSAPVKHAADCKCRHCVTQRNEPIKESCSACGRTRLCQIDVTLSRDPKTHIIPTWAPRYCIKECLGRTVDERKQAREDARDRRRAKEPPLAWPIIGGPLDGKFAVPTDFYSENGKPGYRWYRPEGRYHEHEGQYNEFNAGHGGHRKIGGFPTMIFVHVSLTPGMIRGADR